MDGPRAASGPGRERLTLPPAPDLTVLIVDDQLLLRAGFRKLLDGEPGLQVVGAAGDGQEAVAMVDRLHPDVVLMDIPMPVLDAIEATRRIGLRAPGTAVLVLTTYDLDEYVFTALEAGASGFLLKDCPPRRARRGHPRGRPR